ncbi:hypothetical protein ACTFIY_007444 [Dictyostelium cf. discoideum]
MENPRTIKKLRKIKRLIKRRENVNLLRYQPQDDDTSTIQYWPDDAIYWRGIFSGFDYIIFGVAVGAFSNINMSYFWASVLTLGLNFFILLGRQALMWEFDLKNLQARLMVDAFYFNALAPVDSQYGSKKGVFFAVILGIIICSGGLVEQARIYKNSFQDPYFSWEPSPDFQLDPIFNMFVINLLNLFCAILNLFFYFKLTRCVSYGNQTPFFYSLPLVGGNNINQSYHPNKLELVMILLDKQHLNKFARECNKNHIYLQLEGVRERRIIGP